MISRLETGKTEARSPKNRPLKCSTTAQCILYFLPTFFPRRLLHSIAFLSGFSARTSHQCGATRRAVDPLFSLQIAKKVFLSLVSNSPALFRIKRYSVFDTASTRKCMACSTPSQTFHYNNFRSPYSPVFLADLENQRSIFQNAKAQMLKLDPRDTHDFSWRLCAPLYTVTLAKSRPALLSALLAILISLPQ